MFRQVRNVNCTVADVGGRLWRHLARVASLNGAFGHTLARSGVNSLVQMLETAQHLGSLELWHTSTHRNGMDKTVVLLMLYGCKNGVNLKVEPRRAAFTSRPVLQPTLGWQQAPNRCAASTEAFAVALQLTANIQIWQVCTRWRLST